MRPAESAVARAEELNRVWQLIRAEGGAVENMLLDEIEHLRRRRETAKREMQKARAEADHKEQVLAEVIAERNRLRDLAHAAADARAAWELHEEDCEVAALAQRDVYDLLDAAGIESTPPPITDECGCP